MRHPHHGRPQQPVFNAIAALQLIDHVIVRDLVGIHHLHRLVQVGIEDFTFGRKRLHAQLGQRIVKLLVDQLDARAKS